MSIWHRFIDGKPEYLVRHYWWAYLWHWGVYRHLRKEIKANAAVLITAIVFDVVVLSAFLMVKASTDMMVIYAALVGVLIVFVGERFYLRQPATEEGATNHEHGR